MDRGKSSARELWWCDWDDLEEPSFNPQERFEVTDEMIERGMRADHGDGYIDHLLLKNMDRYRSLHDVMERVLTAALEPVDAPL